MKAATAIPFVKSEACSNDFLIIESIYLPEDPAGLSRRLCDRHTGIGADGVEWVTLCPDGLVSARLINSDGSEAEISGNGTRCVAAWMVSLHGGNEVRVLTGAGEKRCTLMRKSQNTYEFRMAMGRAQVLGKRTISTRFGDAEGWEISLGNPHFVEFVDEFPQDWQACAAEIEGNPAFPHRTNVELVKILGQNRIKFRIYERGAGETQSSGTGSCAAAIAAIDSGKAISPVEVHAPGGMQVVSWDGLDGLTLEGPARLICRGEFLL